MPHPAQPPPHHHHHRTAATTTSSSSGSQHPSHPRDTATSPSSVPLHPPHQYLSPPALNLLPQPSSSPHHSHHHHYRHASHLPPPRDDFASHRSALSASSPVAGIPSIHIPSTPHVYDSATHPPRLPHHPSLDAHPGSSPYISYFHHPLSASLDPRGLRSPHPPLTASFLHNQLQQQQYLYSPSSSSSSLHYLAEATKPSALPNLGRHHYLSSPLIDVPSVPGPSSSHLSSSSPYATPSAYPSGPPFLPVPPHSTSHSHHTSPVVIPPPLRFKYSASPPTSTSNPSTMPPRKKASDTSMVTPSTRQTVSSSVSSRRRGPVAKGVGWTMEHTFDSVGQKKEVIVIDDSESPGKYPRKRTRAAVAAEQQALTNGGGSLNGSVNGSVAGSIVNGGAAGGAAKKRKVDEGSEVGSAKKKGKPSAAVAKQEQAVQQRPQPAIPPTASSVSAANPPWDDAEGHYIVKPDDVIGGRYKIVRLLGQGTFGKVVEARHIESRRKVAIKVIRAVQKYRDASKIEIRVLETLKKHDPNNYNKCIHLEEYFDFRNHPCLVSELYGMSVFDFLKQNSFQPFPEKHIQDFAKSLLKSVEYLHRLKLVHTDLKPENILLVSNESRLQGPRVRNAKSKSILRNTDIRLIDFGSATFENEYHSSVVSTRHYRAPEIILGLTWSYPCDMFSIGCILVEFYTGEALFQTHDNLEHLAMMEKVMGKMPSRLIERGRYKKGEFFKGNKIDFPNAQTSKSSSKYVRSLKSLREIIQPTNPHNQLFLDLITRLLDHDPDTRIRVSDALRHPYLSLDIPPPP